MTSTKLNIDTIHLTAEPSIKISFKIFKKFHNEIMIIFPIMISDQNLPKMTGNNYYQYSKMMFSMQFDLMINIVNKLGKDFL